MVMADSGKTGGVKPFLKWAGGKYRLAHRIVSLLPPGKRLVEPFAGSAAIWLNSGAKSALICDLNTDLIGLYRCLQREGEPFIDFCHGFFTPETNTRSAFGEFRDEFNTTADPARKAALLLYLNRHGFNGLTRYNGKGRFNVPFGKYARPYFPLREMRAFVQKTAECETVFQASDFRDCFAQAREGDVMYCDPPYVPHSATANFTAYWGPFGPDEHAQLARLAAGAALRGIPVVLSNHDNAVSRSLYAGARLETFAVRRHISCKGAERGAAPELLALFKPGCPRIVL